MTLISNAIDLDSLEEPDQFELQDLIGEGTYGEVFQAIDLTALNANPTGKHLVAIKILENIQENMNEVEVELNVLRDLSIHPNLPAFYGIYLKKTPKPENFQMWFVMELCSGGSVADLAKCMKKFEGRKLTELQIAYILKEVVDALTHLHSNHCMHRDVKGHNILLTSEGAVKLIDFGVAYQLNSTYDKRNTSIGTPFYMAPEVIACERQDDSWYDIRCDVWSLGITAIELAEGEPPLADVNPMRALFQIPRNPPPTLKKPDDWSKEFNEIISECLVKDILHRPFAIELAKHPFFLQVANCSDRIRQQLVSEIQLMKAHSALGKGREPEVTTKHGKLKTSRKSGLHTMFVDDLASLSSLDEETIINQLDQRFKLNSIYTYIGDILIVINPYEDLGIYTDFYQYRYRGASLSDLPPHIFGMADQAYLSMLHQKRSQNIVISGESGSGKTETSKFLLQQLVYLGKAPNRNIESKLMQLNSLLEAFGNAVTGINLNSSRFGRYLDVTFTKAGKVTGAYISVYLLEETRIDHQALGERNFHIFYYLLDGLQNLKIEPELNLDKKNYAYLTHQMRDFSVEKNMEHFEIVNEGFYTLGFRQEEIDSIYRILAAILHLGEINFHTGDDDEGCSIKNNKDMETVAKLLGISSGDLGLCLTTRSVESQGETFLRRHSITEANATKNALARGLYSRLFRWIVNQINALLGISRIAYGDPLSVGILDIFGFETCSTNSLEQLYINITNEQLQFYFNHTIFSWEQQEYMAEGIDVEVIYYADNRPILDLCLGQPKGIISLLDEESHFNRATERTLIQKFDKNLSENKFYQKPKSKADLSFSVWHYAGKVNYSAKDFIRKNRNDQSPDIIEVLRNSSFEVVRTFYRCLITNTGQLYVVNRRESIWQLQKQGSPELSPQANSQQTASKIFRHSLADLMSKLLSGDPHFVKCIKPNDAYEPKQFDNHKVLKQLRYGGILETIRIRQFGYSHRFSFKEFVKRYCFLAFGFDERVVADRDTSRLLLLRLKLDGWKIGKSKVFLKYYHVEYLSKLSERQSCIRRWLAKLKVKKTMFEVAKVIVSTKKAAKLWMKSSQVGKAMSPAKVLKKKASSARRRTLGLVETVYDDDKSAEERAVILIQSRVRGFLVRKKYGPALEERIKQIVMSIEKAEEAREALKSEGLDEEDAALVLQRYYRKWKTQQSVEEDESDKENVPKNVESWDAPFLHVEEEMRAERAGIKKKHQEKVDIIAYRKELIMAGLQSQDLAKQERVRLGERKREVASSDSNTGKKRTNLGRNLLQQSLKQKVQAIAMLQDSDTENDSTKALPIAESAEKSSVVLNKIGFLGNQGGVDIPPPSEEDQGPMDFRKLLRKTKH